MKFVKLFQGDCLEVLKGLDSESVDCVVTSPPYWALRDYGVDGQLGLEKTFEEYIEKLLTIFDEVQRVLKSTGTCWVNLGDTYAGSGKGVGGDIKKSKEVYQMKEKPKVSIAVPDKCLVGVPFRFALGMVDRGWILRNTLVWHKPNCMPSSARDRFPVDFEYVFFFSKSKKYWFEQQRTPTIEKYSEKRAVRPKTSIMKAIHSSGVPAGNFTYNKLNPLGKNMRCVWSICPQPYKEAHFAVFPEKLVATPIKAGCPKEVCLKCGKNREKIIETSYEFEKNKDGTFRKVGKNKEDWTVAGKSKFAAFHQHKNRAKRIDTPVGLTDCGCGVGFSAGVVMDIFAGSGTTLKFARDNGYSAIGIELKGEYCDLIKKRLGFDVQRFESDYEYEFKEAKE